MPDYGDYDEDSYSSDTTVAADKPLPLKSALKKKSSYGSDLAAPEGSTDSQRPTVTGHRSYGSRADRRPSPSLSDMRGIYRQQDSGHRPVSGVPDRPDSSQGYTALNHSNRVTSHFTPRTPASFLSPPRIGHSRAVSADPDMFRHVAARDVNSSRMPGRPTSNHSDSRAPFERANDGSHQAGLGSGPSEPTGFLSPPRARPRASSTNSRNSTIHDDRSTSLRSFDPHKTRGIVHTMTTPWQRSYDGNLVRSSWRAIGSKRCPSCGSTGICGLTIEEVCLGLDGEGNTRAGEISRSALCRSVSLNMIRFVSGPG